MICRHRVSVFALVNGFLHFTSFSVTFAERTTYFFFLSSCDSLQFYFSTTGNWIDNDARVMCTRQRDVRAQ